MYMEFFNLSTEDVYNMSRYTDASLLLELETREENDFCFISLCRFSVEQIQGFMEHRDIFLEEMREPKYNEREDF